MNAGALWVRQAAAPLRQRVTDLLRTAIADGTFGPGDRLVERDLCERTGVSRTSIREAFRALEAEGLIESVPNRGPVVARISAAQAAEIYELRGLLEALASRRFAERGTTDQRAALATAYRDLVAAMRGGTTPERLVAKKRFYDVLLDGSGNAELAKMLQPLQGRISLLRAATLSDPARVEHSIAEIATICDAIMARDGESAWRASLVHIDAACAAAIRHMEQG
ncbi:MAG: GntR family transcriptional regulator [Candidatus Elarobacter sp.]